MEVLCIIIHYFHAVTTPFNNIHVTKQRRLMKFFTWPGTCECVQQNVGAPNDNFQ